ncbi:hypothetical protein D0Z00_000129 [Geotrichum galactomycetum]|uniref:Uncharacterized protein n=1 Tax=Geotrichum galactomycetum TaxID=27317 RepID=A0ACB6VAG8_9ASCO|nr:hypothetical protein D0Z00_000129 [Geotrichum candidum]
MKLTTPIVVPVSPSLDPDTDSDADLKDLRPPYQTSDSFGDTILTKGIIKPTYNIKHFYLPPPTSPFEDTPTPLVSDSSSGSYFNVKSPIAPPVSSIYPESISNAYTPPTPSVYAEPPAQVLCVIQPEAILEEQILAAKQVQDPEPIVATKIIEKSLLDEKYIDWTVFSQILEMDEDEVAHEFSRNLLRNYFDQAHQTFQDMESALVESDATKLGQLALLLQGSSAALGFTSVTVLCEAISALGAEARVDEIRELYFQVRQSYTDTRFLLEEFFGRSFE